MEKREKFRTVTTVALSQRGFGTTSSQEVISSDLVPVATLW
jgi:hypothetical protein